MTAPGKSDRVTPCHGMARLDIPGALHHIMVRGINKSAIFNDDQDKTLFLQRLGQNLIEEKCDTSPKTAA